MCDLRYFYATGPTCFSRTEAKVGDIVTVTNPLLKRWHGQKFTIQRLSSSMPGWVYVTFQQGSITLCPDDFVLTKASSNSLLLSCQDCKGTGKIQLLTSIVDCGCV